MLVLTRKPGESILIGDDVELMIGDLNENKVKIAIKAPQEVSIKRGEMVDRSDDDGKADRGQRPAQNGGRGTEGGKSEGSRRFQAIGSAQGRRREVINPEPGNETPSDGQRALRDALKTT